MRRTMRAYRILGWEQPPQLVETDVPSPGPGQVLVKVAGNGLCHSDTTMSQIPESIGEMIGWRVPFTLGHEIAGWVEDIGDGVVEGGVGDPVALVSPESDGTCRYCLRGQDSACPNGLAGRGYGRDGGLAEFVLVRSTRHVIKLDTLDPVSAGPLTDAGATSYHAVKRILPRLEPGDTAVVIGAGGLGSFAVQHLRALSAARVVAVDTNPARLEYARSVGAHDVVAGVDGATGAEIRRLAGGDGAAAVLDFVGADATIAAGVGAVRPFGALGVVGAAGGTFRGPWYGGLPRDGEVFNFQGSTIADARAVIALAEAGLIRSDVDRFPLDRVGEAYEALDAGRLQGRAVVTPD
jgi:propanol-preferring alcohol dehydrogenase